MTSCAPGSGFELAPGTRLIERDLAEELEVSHIPLREAMQRLQQDEQVVVVPRQGAIVSPFTVDYVRDLFDVRESLEVLAARDWPPNAQTMTGSKP